MILEVQPSYFIISQAAADFHLCRPCIEINWEWTQMNVVGICLATIDKLCVWTRVSFRMTTMPWRTEFPVRRRMPKLLPVFSGELGIQITFYQWCAVKDRCICESAGHLIILRFSCPSPPPCLNQWELYSEGTNSQRNKQPRCSVWRSAEGQKVDFFFFFFACLCSNKGEPFVFSSHKISLLRVADSVWQLHRNFSSGRGWLPRCDVSSWWLT